MRSGRRHLAVLLAVAVLAALVLLLLTAGPATGPGSPGSDGGPREGPRTAEGTGADSGSRIERLPALTAPPTAGAATESALRPEARPEPPPAAPAPPTRSDPRDLPEAVAAVVRDDATDRPVAGARVLLVHLTESPLVQCWGDRTGGDGSFRFSPRESLGGRTGLDFKSVRLEVRIRAPGYRDFRFDARELRGDIRLVPDPTPPLPGTVRGTARGSDGRAWTGRLCVEAFDQDFGNYLCQWCCAAGDGTYAMAGVPAGPWKMHVLGPVRDYGKDLREVRVPEGGEVWMDLEGVVGGGTVQAEDRIGDGGREVRVTGLPAAAGAGAFLRAEWRPGHLFREPVGGGACRFPEIPPGKWALVLEVPGREDARREVVVEAGEGTQVVAWE